jgi:hypothetical protein
MTKAFKSTPFASIPYELMDVMTERGGKQIICVYLWLHRFGWGSDQGCWASLATIAKSSGIKVKDVQQALRYLIAEGWVVQTPRPGRTSVFFVRMHRDERAYDQMTHGPKGHSTTRVPKGHSTRVPEGHSTPGPKGHTNKNPRTKTQEQKPISTRDASAASKDPNRLKTLPTSSVPDDLAGCAELLIEFWQCKKGVRSTPVLNRICKKLRNMTPQQRQEALERSIACGWGDVFAPQKQAGYSAVQEPAAKHPAHRVFTADHGFTDQPATNPVLNGLF